MTISFSKSALLGQNSREGIGGRKRQGHHAGTRPHDIGMRENFYVVREDNRIIKAGWTERLIEQFNACSTFR